MANSNARIHRHPIHQMIMSVQQLHLRRKRYKKERVQKKNRKVHRPMMLDIPRKNRRITKRNRPVQNMTHPNRHTEKKIDQHEVNRNQDRTVVDPAIGKSADF